MAVVAVVLARAAARGDDGVAAAARRSDDAKYAAAAWERDTRRIVCYMVCSSTRAMAEWGTGESLLAPRHPHVQHKRMMMRAATEPLLSQKSDGEWRLWTFMVAVPPIGLLGGEDKKRKRRPARRKGRS